jgi:DNA topoisomerase
MKNLYIAEKPSVANEFAKALKLNTKKKQGFLEADNAVVTWCVGHLVTMSYPESYGEQYKRWSLDTLPFLPKVFKYEVIDAVKEQYKIVSGLLNREDIACIYICTDSGREGEYIYRLVDNMAKVNKPRKRVWIDSQTEEEILRGIKEAKDWSFYDNLASSAYLRAKEDYLMGINFSRLLTLKYSKTLATLLKKDRVVLSVGRVMTCVVGMVVRREREIRDFKKTVFYKIIVKLAFENKDNFIEGEFRAVEESKYYNSPKLYKDNGFLQKEDADKFILELKPYDKAKVVESKKKKELRNPPLLYNLAELQNDCSKKFKISPDETLKIAQKLYERKLLTYPRTDARVLSKAVAKEIYKNLSGLKRYETLQKEVEEVINNSLYKNLEKTRYVDDKKITDHYAIIPTGQVNLSGLSPLELKVYELICRRFISIFFPAAEYMKYNIESLIEREHFFTTFKVLTKIGYLKVSGAESEKLDKANDTDDTKDYGPEFINLLNSIKKGSLLNVKDMYTKTGETSAPKRYSSGSMILAMENAGQLIEDEELRSQIKSSGIGTSATRAEILKKLITIKYLSLNPKTQVITPSLYGEMVYEAVYNSIRQLLNPALTASWEKGLSMITQGSIDSKEYMDKLEHFVKSKVLAVANLNNQYSLNKAYQDIYKHYN